MARGRRKPRNNYNADSLQDALSGIGGSKDILATGTMGFANYVTRNTQMMSAMFRGNTWVKKSVSIPAQYAVKGWRKLEDDKFIEAEKHLNLKAKTAEALQWSLLFGGSLAFMVVDDGLSPDKPLNLNNLNPDSFKKIIIVDRSKVSTIGEVNQDVLSDNFQEPEKYLLTIGRKQITAHHTRCHKFVVNKLPFDETIREDYWGVSQIEIIYRQLINDDVFLSSMANMMKKATTDVFGIPGLAQMIKSGNEQAINDRVRVLHSTMSTLNAFVKDAGYNGQNEETYERITQAFAGFDAMDIQSLNRLAAAAEIPATIFLGKSPDGMNATGTSDLSIFSDRLTTTRELDIDPFLYRVDEIIAKCNNTERSPYEWLNPFPKSELDDATIRKANMDIIMLMHQMEASNKIIANQMAKHGIIDNDEVDDMVSSLELEPYEIEDTTENEL